MPCLRPAHGPATALVRPRVLEPPPPPTSPIPRASGVRLPPQESLLEEQCALKRRKANNTFGVGKFDVWSD